MVEGLEENPNLIDIANEEVRLVTSSPDWAWMIGVLAGGGHISRLGMIMFAPRFEQLRRVIISQGEKLFSRNARIETHLDPKRSPTIVFGNREAAYALGSFTRDQYVNTIIERHSWLVDHPILIWSFLQGIFETKGGFYKNTNNRFEYIRLHTVFIKEANFLTDLLVRVGITEVSILKSHGTREEVSAVTLTSLEDLRRFSEHVYSVIPAKEDKLAFYRTIDPSIPRHRTYLRDEAIADWLKAKAILGHTPTEHYITQLKGLGLIQCSPQVFGSLFNESGLVTDFNSAREAIEKTLVEQAVPVSLDNVEIERARQVFDESRKGREPRRMPKRVTDEEIIQSWIKARNVLGHIPTSIDLERLSEQGIIGISVPTFVGRFGAYESRKSFAQARDTLEALVKERGGSELGSKLKEQRVVISNEELIAEWIRIMRQLNRVPSYSDIAGLREVGKTKYSPKSYVDRFGVEGQKKSFNRTRDSIINLIRQSTSDSERNKYQVSSKAYLKSLTDEEVATEWVRLRRILGHLPSIPELVKRISRGETLVTPRVYSFRFGDGRWSNAIVNLEKTFFRADINTLLQQYEDRMGKQVHYTTKLHRDLGISLEKQINRLAEISKSVQLPPVLFYAYNGSPLIFGDEIPVKPDEGDSEIHGSKNSVTLYGPNLNSELFTVITPEIPEPTIIVIGGTRDKSEIKTGDELLKPSRDLAWSIGVLAGGAYVNLGTGAIEVGSDKYVLDEFKRVGEYLFNEEISTHHYTRKNNGSREGDEYHFTRARFCNRQIASVLGDLRRRHWPNTVREKHPWILNEQDYTWSFLEGFFDTRGSISLATGRKETTPPHPAIYLSTTADLGANALIEMLKLVEINNAFIHSSKNTKEGVRGVAISNLDDVRNFASHVHSKIPELEEKLEFCRRRYSHRGEFIIFEDDELISQWQELTDLLGHGPSSWELRKLHKSGRLVHTAGTYAQRFGGGRFIEARKTLDVLINT